MAHRAGIQSIMDRGRGIQGIRPPSLPLSRRYASRARGDLPALHREKVGMVHPYGWSIPLRKHPSMGLVDRGRLSERTPGGRTFLPCHLRTRTRFGHVGRHGVRTSAPGHSCGPEHPYWMSMKRTSLFLRIDDHRLHSSLGCGR